MGGWDGTGWIGCGRATCGQSVGPPRLDLLDTGFLCLSLFLVEGKRSELGPSPQYVISQMERELWWVRVPLPMGGFPTTAV
jgi:hypothetical protein